MTKFVEWLAKFKDAAAVLTFVLVTLGMAGGSMLDRAGYVRRPEVAKAAAEMVAAVEAKHAPEHVEIEKAITQQNTMLGAVFCAQVKGKFRPGTCVVKRRGRAPRAIPLTDHTTLLTEMEDR